MSERPKRRWLRFHLSTAMLLILGAGGMIGINVAPTKQFVERGHAHNFNPLFIEYTYGWPFELVSVGKEVQHYGLDEQVKELHSKLNGNLSNRKVIDEYENKFSTDEVYTVYNWVGIVCDSGIFLGTLLAIGFACEYLIRCREAKNL